MTAANVARLGGLALLWGSNFLWIKLALDGFTPTQIVAGRMWLGTAVLVVFVVAMRLPLPRERAMWGHLAVAAVLANLAPYFLFAWAEQTVPSAIAGTLNATTPLFTFATAYLAGDERGSLGQRALGLTIGFIGVVLIVAPWQAGGLGENLLGHLALLLASVCYALSYVYMSHFLTHRGYSPLVLATSQFIAASVLLLVVSPAVFSGSVDLSASPTQSLLILGALGTGAAYILNYRLITDAGSVRASTVTYLLPVVAVVLGVVVLDESLDAGDYVGAVAVLIGVWFAQRHRERARVPDE